MTKRSNISRASFARRSITLGIVLAGATLGAFGVSAGANDDRAVEIDGARTALEQWVETRRLISKEKRDWALGREILESRIELAQNEIEGLREKTTEIEGGVADADRKRDELIAKRESLKVVAEGLAETIADLEARTLAILPRLPEPLLEQVARLSQQIPKDPSETELSLSIRFQNVVGTLNIINKFDTAITTTSEVRRLSEDTQAEVTAFYVGLGHAFYATADGASAGTGRATEAAWEWRPDNAAAAEIVKAIAILAGEETAEFVQLPVTIE